MQSTTSFSKSDVVLVPFPFTNQREVRLRPAVVVSNGAYNQSTQDVILGQITGNLTSPGRMGDHSIQDWQAAGLLMPSRFRAKFATLHRSLIRRRLGTMPAPDMTAIDTNVRQVLDL